MDLSHAFTFRRPHSSLRFLAPNTTSAASTATHNDGATSAALFATVVFVGVIITVTLACVIQFVRGVKQTRESEEKRQIRLARERRTTVSSTENILAPSASQPVIGGRATSSMAGSLTSNTPVKSQEYVPNASYQHCGEAPRLEELPRTAAAEDEYYDSARRAAEARRQAASIAARQLESITNGSAHASHTPRFKARPPRRHSRRCTTTKVPKETAVKKNISSL
ncbi:hypothetical protein FOZ62_007043 [Perkinsus olseni]|uniref:Uncharacterized protein n=1 Tax=Perkinsus olseni TaxID=32597 RepID=A0A7J6TTL9_PEROL|nr:hypothetical protein FOZ62_007043 [Perkinsus olseni]